MKGIVEIIGDVVKATGQNLSITIPVDVDNDKFEMIENPNLNYIFGSLSTSRINWMSIAKFHQCLNVNFHWWLCSVL